MKTQNAAAKTAFAAASAANAAAQAATAAKNLLYRDPAAWGFADQAYWLCKAAVEAAQNAADALDPEVGAENPWVLSAHASVTTAAEEAQNAADELVSLAEKADHEIRR